MIEPPSSGSSGADLFRGLRKLELSRFLRRAAAAAGVRGTVDVLLADDGRIQELNRSFRGKNAPTDVLSFPAGEYGAGHAGDLAISVETANTQARAHGHTLTDELHILLLHGLLHLAGHDHESDAGEMRTLEAELRARLGLPQGLIERTHSRPSAKSGKAAPLRATSSKAASRGATRGAKPC